MKEVKTTCYFYYYVQEDDLPKLAPFFMAKIVDAEKEPGRQRSKSSDGEPLN